MATLNSIGDCVWIDAHCLHCGCRADQHASPADEYTASYFDIYPNIYIGAANNHIHTHTNSGAADGNNHTNACNASVMQS